MNAYSTDPTAPSTNLAVSQLEAPPQRVEPLSGVQPYPSGPLPYLGVIRFAGPDAVSFLQGQLSNDARRLTAGSTLLAAYSTPQGRVAAVLHLLPHSSGIMALLPHEIVTPTIERLRKFVLRAKLQIEDVSGQFPVAGYQTADALRSVGLEPPASAGLSYAEHDGIGIGRVRADDDRCWVVGAHASATAAPGVHAASEATASSGATASPVEQAWRLADIRSGLPQVYAATREMFVAQMLNLDRIDGISFTKGCFTGQEIIARTQHLGRIKRRLFRLRLPPGTWWAIGQAIHLADGRTGRLTELASAPAGIEALAVLPLEPGAAAELDAGADAAAAAVDAVQLPLPYAFGE